MKFQAVLLLCLVGLITAKFQVRTKEDAIEAHEACHSEFKIPDEIYEQFLNYVFPEHRRTNCYIKCFLEKMELFTENKGFDEKNIIKQFTYKHSKNLGSVQHGLEKCIDHNEWDTDTCTWANRVFSCWLKVNRHVVLEAYGDN